MLFVIIAIIIRSSIATTYYYHTRSESIVGPILIFLPCVEIKAYVPTRAAIPNPKLPFVFQAYTAIPRHPCPNHDNVRAPSVYSIVYPEHHPTVYTAIPEHPCPNSVPIVYGCQSFHAQAVFRLDLVTRVSMPKP